MSERRTTVLKRLITRPQIAFLMEAHSGLSARIVEEAGFEGIWGSGLTISASFGVRDNNELSWSQVVDHVAFMAEATSIPLLLDGDTGYGNFNNMRRLVRKLEQVGVAGVTIEDKQFPKTNSFLRSELQPLADIEEFCGKIKAGKDSQTDADFVLVARVEALIAGWGLAEAIKRAEAYHRAGADAILIHSRQSSPAEIFAFLEEWGNRAPVVLVPTKYWRTPTEDFRARHVSVVIWANHALRASISAMQAAVARIRAAESLIDVEPNVAPLHDVFRLQGDDELQEAEKRYLPVARGPSLSAVVLAAGAASDFGGLTRAVPKAMLRVQGRPIVARLLDDFAHFGCRNVTVVRGHHAAAVDVAGARFVDNPEFAETGEAFSLAVAEDSVIPGTLVAFGDIVLKRHLIQALLEDAGEGITLVVDSMLATTAAPDRVRASRPDSGLFEFDEVSLVAIGDDVTPSHGAWIGLLHAGRDGAAWLREAIAAARADGTLRAARLSDLITRIVAAGRTVRVVYARGGWVNVNNLTDLLAASDIGGSEIGPARL
jgi:phosphoenolpyruvate phosphomutase